MVWERRNAILNSPEEEEAVAVRQGDEGLLPDRMVKIEMEAAEALAELALLAARGRGSGSGGKVAGRARRRRVKTESPPSPPELNPVDSAPSRSDLAQDCAALSLQQHAKPRATIYHPKSEQCAQPLDQSHICTRDSVPLRGGRSRQNLSEAEKEAKRLRRVLANRESARRTIRRRQALCEELTRKAIELTEENEKLKKGMETAVREFQKLETTNKHLKAEFGKALEHEAAKAAKCKSVGTSELKHARIEMPTINFPILLHNTLLTPCLCHPTFQSPNASKLYQVLPSLPSVEANVITRASSKPDPTYEQALLSISGTRNPAYILPCPWIFTLSNHGCHCECTHCCKSEQDENGVASSSKTAASSGKCEPALPALVKPEEAPGTTRTGLVDDLNEIPVESVVDQCGQHVGLCSEEAASKPEQASSTGVEIARRDGKPCSDLIEKTDVVEFPFPAGHLSLTEKDGRESVNCSGDKRIANTSLAAEARRRRKELTKLKVMHGQQCRTHC